MKKWCTEVKKIEQVYEVVCNYCGKPIAMHKSHGVFDDFISIEKAWGYYSEFDNEIHKFDLCQECYKKLINKFKIPIHCDDLNNDLPFV